MPNISIKWIKEKVNGVKTKIYPITHTDAVRDSEGNILTDLLEANGFGCAVCTTAEATLAKTVTIEGYSLISKGIIAVQFTNAVPASSTLNVSEKGAKAIYYRGAAIEDNIIKAGDTASLMYDGTNYIVTAIEKGNVSVSYDPTTKGMVFPANSGVSYDSTTKGMVF